MSSAREPEADLARIAKAVMDLDDLVRLTLGGLSRAKRLLWVRHGSKFGWRACLNGQH
jgi:hypothetical protein